MRSQPRVWACRLPQTHGWFIALAMVLFGGVTAAHADSITLGAIADTTLQQAFPNNEFGGGVSFTSGDRRRGGITRALLAFDIAGNLPTGATITAATLTLTVVDDPGGGVTSIFDLNRLLALARLAQGHCTLDPIGAAAGTISKRHTLGLQLTLNGCREGRAAIPRSSGDRRHQRHHIAGAVDTAGGLG